MRKTRLAAIAMAAGAVIGLAACGGSTSSGGQPGTSGVPAGAPSAQALVNDALTTLKSATSVRVSGAVVQSGKNLQLNLGFFKSGALSGTMTGPFAGTQSTFKLIITGGKAYVLIDKAFFDALSKAHGIPSSACSQLCGKYIAVPASQFGNSFNLKGLTSSMLKGDNKAVPGVTTTSVNGVPAYRVSDGHGSYLYIAENGTHYPLEITKAGTGTLTFSQWNSVPPITAPPSSQIISVPGGL